MAQAFEILIFLVFAAMTIGLALVVITSKNPVVSAIALVGSLFALAVLYVLLEAPFIAALQVIIYAGAIMVLFLFVIMLLNLQRQEEERTHPVQQFLGYTSAAAFAITLVWFIAKGTAMMILPEGRFMSDARAIGSRLFQAYLFPFEMVSILLLAAIVGAILLTQKQNKAE